MEKNKNLLILSLIATALILIGIINISAIGVSINVPATGGAYSQNISVNILSINVPQLQNCSVYAKSASTANSSWVNVGLFVNATVNTTAINGTFNTSFFEDSNDYMVNATCRMTNGTSTTTTNTGITFDNTIPTAPTLSPSTNTLVSSSTTQTFTGTVNDATTTSCTYAIARGGATSGADYITGSASYSGSSCTFTKSFTSTLDDGDWWWSITSSDGTNTTNSGQIHLQVEIPATGGNTCVSSGGQIVNEECVCPEGTAYDSGYGCYDINNPPSDIINPPTEPSNMIYWIVGIIIAIIIVIIIISSK